MKRKILIAILSVCLLFCTVGLAACTKDPATLAGVQSIQKTATNGNVDTYTVTLTDGKTTTFTVTNGTEGPAGVSITNAEINQDGELIISLSEGEPINVGKVEGEAGTAGMGISSIAKTGTNGKEDTYKIALTDGSFVNFTVTNGADGTPGVGIDDVILSNYELSVVLTDGTRMDFGNIRGADGAAGVGIVTIAKARTNGKVDTYRISLSDGTFVDFDVTNGTDGAPGVGIADVVMDDYELTVELTNGGSVYLGDVRGAQGESAYEIYKRVYNYTGTEEQWLQRLMAGTLVNEQPLTVTFDPANGEEVFTQQVTHGEKVTLPDEPVKDDYLFAGWYCGEEAWVFSGYVVTEDITLTAKWDFLVSDLPVISIDTAGAEISGTDDYTTAVISVENCDDEIVDAAAGIRLRGNSTRWQPKKPYRIKFDKKQSLFGLEKAKSWVLLAEYLDPSSLNNTVAFAFAKQLPNHVFIPTTHKVNVYINGKYNGLYTVCEQVQENPGRMDMEMDAVTEEMSDLKDYNFFIGMEGQEPPDANTDPSAVEDETYFKVQLASGWVRYFELKYPEKEDFPSEAQFVSFMSQLKTYTTTLFQAFEDKNKDWIDAETNVNTLIDYLIVDEVMGQRDHHQKSFNLYYTNTSDVAEENGKVNFGPIWDYDWSLNVPWDSSPNDYYEVTDTLNYSNICFSAVRWMPEYYQMVKQRWNDYGVYALSSVIDSLDETVAEMQDSLQLNQEFWYDSIDPELTEKNIQFLKRFLMNRRRVLNEAWAL